MSIELLKGMDFTAWEQPEPGENVRDLLVGWLRYQRHEFLRKLRDLSPEDLVAWSVPPLELSVLGLVRHMTQMEHVYLTWGLGGGERMLAYGEDDYAGGAIDTIDDDLRKYFAEVEKADRAIAALPDYNNIGQGHGRPLGPTLVKMLNEYSIHAGQAHMLRFAALGEIIR